MGEMFGERISLVGRDNFYTAYGPAVKVPDQLRRLAGADRKAALDARCVGTAFRRADDPGRQVAG